jgi:Flp pilus assembly protein TadG
VIRIAHRFQGRDSGQSLVEFAAVVPIIMMLMLGMLEFGFVFTHQVGLEYATREGARMGAALGSGTDQIVPADVDKNIIAAFQRVVTSSGSQLNVTDITEVRIFSADANGDQIAGLVNVWVPGWDGVTQVDGVNLQFKPSGGTPWQASARKNSWTVVAGVSTPPDSIGVSLTYNYRFVTPLGNFVRAFSTGTLVIGDKTVMAINPT